MKMKVVVVAMLTLVFSGCESNEDRTVETSTQTQNSPTQAPALPVVTSVGDQTSPNIQAFAVIREFQSNHAALFLVQSDQTGLAIIGESGISDLGDAHVGTLDESSMDGLFNNVPAPMLLSEKQQILDKYKGASFVYYENYSGSLCSGDRFELDVASKLPGWGLSTGFNFVAESTYSGECKFLSQSLMTTSWSQQ
jgi:hypothetical protein